jgi:hypothetical protein
VVEQEIITMPTLDMQTVLTIAIVSSIATGLVIWVVAKLIRNRPRAVFYDLVRKYPTAANTSYLSEAEQKAFESVKDYVSDKTRVEISSKSRLDQLKRIRGDLIFIQKECTLGRFQKLPQIQEIWDLTLQKAAAQIAEEYQFDNLLDQVAQLRHQMEVLSESDNPNVDRDSKQDSR